MKSDAQLKHDVLAELEWEPTLNAAHVGVTVDQGVVTLSGHLDTFAEKYAIERAVQRVSGVKAVAVELDVKLAPGHQRSDSELAVAAQSALKWNALVPDEQVQLKVEKGRVTLSGQVHWEYQRAAAERTLRAMTGVVGIVNLLTLKPRATPDNVGQRIREALARHADREAKKIEVVVDGSTVTVRGEVDSWTERRAVQGAAWSAPGVTRVVDHLRIRA